jgi:hypothetical protein
LSSFLLFHWLLPFQSLNLNEDCMLLSNLYQILTNNCKAVDSVALDVVLVDSVAVDSVASVDSVDSVVVF